MSQQKPVVIRVRAKLSAREDRLTRDAEGHLVARVSGRPVDGRANQAIQALVAKKLDVARRDVTIVGGAHGRLKRIARRNPVGDREITCRIQLMDRLGTTAVERGGGG